MFTDHFTSSPAFSWVKLGKMSKIDEMKDKITQLKAKVQAKIDAIPFLKKLAEKKPEAAAAPKSNVNLSSVYRDGGVFTRLQVILFYLLVIATLASSGMMAKKIWTRVRHSDENEKLKKEYTKGFEDVRHRMEERAEMISVGATTVNAYAGEGKLALVKVDIWIKVSDPEAAAFADKHDLLLHDKATDALNELYNKKMSLLSDEGKEMAKKRIKENLNSVIQHGVVEEVFFHNLVIQ